MNFNHIQVSRLSEILEMPRIINNIHESSFRSNAILMYILEMVDRGDSKETILDVYMLLSQYSRKEPDDKK